MGKSGSLQPEVEPSDFIYSADGVQNWRVVVRLRRACVQVPGSVAKYLGKLTFELQRCTKEANVHARRLSVLALDLNVLFFSFCLLGLDMPDSDTTCAVPYGTASRARERWSMLRSDRSPGQILLQIGVGGREAHLGSPVEVQERNAEKPSDGSFWGCVPLSCNLERSEACESEAK